MLLASLYQMCFGHDYLKVGISPITQIFKVMDNSRKMFFNGLDLNLPPTYLYVSVDLLN